MYYVDPKSFLKHKNIYLGLISNSNDKTIALHNLMTSLEFFTCSMSKTVHLSERPNTHAFLKVCYHNNYDNIRDRVAVNMTKCHIISKLIFFRIIIPIFMKIMHTDVQVLLIVLFCFLQGA